MGRRPCATTLQPEMSGGELSALANWIGGIGCKGKYLEIGTAAGGTLSFMMNCFDVNARPRFVVVDTMAYFDNQFDTIKSNLTMNGLDAASVDFRVMSSAEAFRKAEVRDEQFKFILVDASHKIRQVMADLRWLKLLEVGGVACFHDYALKFKGVRWPVDRFLKHNPQFVRVGLSGSLLCVKRVAKSVKTEVTATDRIWAIFCAPFLQWELSLRKRFPPKGQLGLI